VVRRSRLQARDSDRSASALSLSWRLPRGFAIRSTRTVEATGPSIPEARRYGFMGWEDEKADAKKAMREVDEKAKETWRKADGEESVSDKVANLGDDIRNELGNAGDEVRRHTDDMEDRPV
jgi:hypothetical protein